MKGKRLLLFLLLLDTGLGFSQISTRPYQCGFVTKDSLEIRQNYNLFWKNLGIQKGESVASVGASNGYVEAQISAVVIGVNWTLQDIDSTCLNQLGKVLEYHEKLIHRKIDGNFKTVLGNLHHTNLPEDSFDRLIMTNVYHELSDRESIVSDVYTSLKRGGRLVLMERMAKKKGQKHGDCGLPKLWEPELIAELNKFSFELVEKVVDDRKLLTFYTFKRE